MAILRVKGIRSWSPRSYTLTHHTKGGKEVLCGYHYNYAIFHSWSSKNNAADYEDIMTG